MLFDIETPTPVDDRFMPAIKPFLQETESLLKKFEYAGWQKMDIMNKKRIFLMFEFLIFMG
jgi:hypothetical protein